MISTLKKIEQSFNANFDISFLKSKVEKALRYYYLNNYEFLKEEYGEDLPNNFTSEDFSVEYKYFVIFTNGTFIHFRIHYEVYLIGDSLPKFLYDMDFDSDGETRDDFFFQP